MADIAIINPVLALEAAGNSGSTHKAVLKASDLVTSGNTETLTIPINAAATDIKQVEVVCLRLITPLLSLKNIRRCRRAIKYRTRWST